MENQKNKILIVDDEKANLKVLTHFLGTEYTIFTATTGEKAIEKARELKPDLVLMDILMPGMDGYQALSAMKNCEILKKIPVIFITGLDSDEDEEKGLSLDAADYITKPFSASIVRLRVRNQIQLINQLRTIESLSMIDQLTNIPNRRSFDHRLIVEWRQAIRDNTAISLLMIDLDRFKAINDIYGHQYGDFILQRVAQIFIKALKRPADFTARWGGEEFIILLPNTQSNGALEVAETIRSDVEETIFSDADGTESKLTISVGVVSIKPKLDSSVEAFLANADKALYFAKDSGRNRVAQMPD